MECPFYSGHRIRREDYEDHVTQQCSYIQKDLLNAVLHKFYNDAASSARGHHQPLPEPVVRPDAKTSDEFWD